MTSSDEPLPQASLSTEPYTYNDLPFDASFRVAEVFPGNADDQVVCRLHHAEWHQRPQYDAVSYTWGSPLDRVRIKCDGKSIAVTRNLYTALVHFRHPNQSRIIWADGLCINQESVPERGLQVKQMKTIYERARQVLVWLGPDNDEKHAATAAQGIYDISEYLSKELGLFLWQHGHAGDTYQEVILKNRDRLALPDSAGFGSKTLLDSLVWLYSHRYFTRVWAIQEVTANDRCTVYIGHSAIVWRRVDIVACYLIMDQPFSEKHGFSKSNCWFVASFAELVNQPTKWLNTLYLASNYSCLDARDVIYGLRGLMSIGKSAHLIDPDYSKSTEEVYRDCVETALDNFNNTDVLLYVTGKESPSWIPRWDVSMLFRNPFRFGRSVPWKPSAETTADWTIDKKLNILHLSGVVIDTIERTETYSQLWFADNAINFAAELQKSWIRVLHTIENSEQALPLPRSALAALAISFAFGLNQKLAASERLDIVRQFVAYLILIFANSKAVLQQYISADLLDESASADGKAFGKPVWDFEYPDGSIFVTKNRLIGCAIATTQPGDVVFVPHGSAYPLIVRPVQAADTAASPSYTIRGFSYTDGVMYGEHGKSVVSRLAIR